MYPENTSPEKSFWSNKAKWDTLYGFLGGSVVKRICLQCRRCRRCSFDPWVGKISWRRKWQFIPVLLPGRSHGQRNLVGYSPWGGKRAEHDLVTEQQQRWQCATRRLAHCYHRIALVNLSPLTGVCVLLEDKDGTLATAAGRCLTHQRRLIIIC